MDDVIKNNMIIESHSKSEEQKSISDLSEGQVDVQYVIKGVETDDEEMKDFLLTLGCYEGETITIISTLGENFIVNIKDARYSIDKELAQAIRV